MVLKSIGMKNLKSDSGKFIPIDARTDEPHRCNGPTESGQPYYPEEIKKSVKKQFQQNQKLRFHKKFCLTSTRFPNL